jgi:hypothetical protein
VNLKVSGLGADKKKIGILVALLAVAAYFYFSGGSTPDSSSSTAAQRGPTNAEPVAIQRAPGRLVSRTRTGQKSFRNSGGEFKPSLKPNKDLVPDRNSIDPTLHTDLLAKLQSVKVEGGSRSIFEIGQAAPVQLKGPEPTKIAVTRKPVGPMPPPPPPPPAPKPQAPPVPLKFYGFVNQNKSGVKRAFFLDGDDIIVASEGQTIKSRYKIVRIGINSAVVEDIQFEWHQQTLPLVEEMPG